MPDIIVHTCFGEEVRERLQIELDRDIYAFGLIGPDPYLFYHFYIMPFHHRVNRYSSIMHRQHTGDFLVELARRSRKNREVFSYLAGFLCHYALDSTVHPYVNRKAKNGFAMHIAIEHRLDRENGGKLVLPPFLPERLKPDVGGAIVKIYGWRDAWEKMKAGRRDMEPFYHMIQDDKGLLNRILYHSHTKAAWLTYQSNAADDIDLRGFYPLYRKAVEYAVTYIKAADRYARGEINEIQLREVIGNRSYIEG